MRSKLFSLAVVVAVAGALLAATPAASFPGGALLLGKGDEHVRDCTASTSLVRGRPAAIRFIVWCGVQEGTMRFDLYRGKGLKIRGFPRRISPRGRGAAGDFRCRRVAGTVKCAGRVEGPLVLRGFVGVDAATRCKASLFVETAASIRIRPPTGCPGIRPQRPPRDWRHMEGFRREFGLDLDLEGDRAAIERRVRDLIASWVRGNPVARATAAELGLPLRAQDQAELEYRDEYLERNAGALESWGPRHAPSTYAGWDFDHENGGIFYIGFVGDQEAQIAEFARQAKVLAPDRIRPFPVPPTYSERRLTRFEEELLEVPLRSKLMRLITNIGPNTLANRVEIGTRHVDVVRRLLAERFGPENPTLVVFEAPGGLLVAK